MRDYILLYINGVEHRVKGADALIPLTDYLRYGISACGTKVVCAEGDCGACTVAVGRVNGDELDYKPVNGCIQYIYQLDCASIITVEGIKNGEELNCVQTAMVECHGAQCGYCTPGFIVAMSSMFDAGTEINRASVKEGLTGNLCRCTGYLSIIDAALKTDAKSFQKFNTVYPPAPMREAFLEHQKEPARIECEGRSVFCPSSLSQAVSFKKENPAAVIISGGTDVCVNMNKRGLEPVHLMTTANLQGLDDIRHDEATLYVGSKVSLRTLETYVKDLIPEFYNILFVFGSPQIRHAATLAGNIANASPIADSLPFLFAMDALIEVFGSAGPRRIKIQSLYKGYKVLSMEPDEIIVRIIIPIPKTDELLKLYKISRREHLDISSFTAAVRMKNENGTIKSPVIAYGGVAPVVLRLKKTEEFLNGKPFTLETFTAAGKVACDEIAPISDVRGARDYRLQLAQNILVRFYHETANQEQLVCL